MRFPAHRLIIGTLTILVLALVGARVGAEEDVDPALKARLEQVDSGPSTIDVSAYPQSAQERYELFTEACTKCHTLARPINSDYALPGEWMRYVKRMMHKPGSGITSSKGKAIYEFLTYDSSIRKHDLVQEKLSAMSAEERKAEEEKIAEIQARLRG